MGALAAATCAWPLYMSLCTDVVVVESERWQKSCWARLDAFLGPLWARKPFYLLPEKYQPPIELSDAASPPAPDANGDAQDAAKESPLSFRPEEPFTLSRPTSEDSDPQPLLAKIAERALEAEKALGTATVQRPTLAIRRLC